MITGHSAACICFGCLNPTTWPKDTKAPLCAPSPYSGKIAENAAPVEPARHGFWGVSGKNFNARVPREGCNCPQCFDIRSSILKSWMANSKFAPLDTDAKLAEKDAQIVALRKDAALLELARQESALHWQRILRQDKTIEELREDRRSIIKDYGDALTELNRVIAELRKQLAAAKQPSIQITADTTAWGKAVEDLLAQLRKPESELISDDLRHLAKQGGPAWSCLISLADRVTRLL